LTSRSGALCFVLALALCPFSGPAQAAEPETKPELPAFGAGARIE